MKKSVFLCLFSAVLLFDAFSQGYVAGFEEIIDSGGLIDEIPLKPIETSGSFYLNEEFQIGNILLKNRREIKNYPIKYDLKYNRMEINAGNIIKVLNCEDIYNFYIFGDNEEYRNVDYFDETNDLGGFFQIIASGSVSLLQHTDIKIMPANYVPETDTGRRSDKIVKTDSYFFSKGKRVFEITGRKNKDLDIFGDRESQVKEFVQDEKISFKNENDLVKLVSFYNSL